LSDGHFLFNLWNKLSSESFLQAAS